MKLFTAMILSSRNQAELYTYHGGGVIAARMKQYRLLATYLPKENAEDFDLSIYHITYPHAQKGKGWGNPVIADISHRSYQYTGLDALHAYLEKLGINYEDGWMPVENEKEED